VERPGIVHRLDRETSGAIVVAKSDAAHLKLARAFHDRKVRKIYGVLVKGEPTGEAGEWDGAIARHGTLRHRMAVVREGGRPSLTLWRICERFAGHAWIDCDLKTGRTHQIRVHCLHARLAVMGDRIYGWREERELTVQPPRVMLHAHELEFRHPITAKPVKCKAPWPEDFLAQVAQLRRGGRP
jgi:23S rRNA pseudouridine1911/1915/1917 synthase